MATYYRGRMFPSDSKFIVHPHYATQAESSNEAIGHQVRAIGIFSFFVAINFVNRVQICYLEIGCGLRDFFVRMFEPRIIFVIFGQSIRRKPIFRTKRWKIVESIEPTEIHRIN